MTYLTYTRRRDPRPHHGNGWTHCAVAVGWRNTSQASLPFEETLDMLKRSFSIAVIGLSLIAPIAEARSRAVKHPCKAPTVTITSSSAAVCANESVRLSWYASDPSAVVSVDGVGGNLSATGSAVVPVPQATTFKASAKSACGGLSPAASVSVAMNPNPSGSISAPSSTNQGTDVSIFISALNASSWSLTSSLGNGLSPASGSGNGDFSSTYYASASGTDSLQLKVLGLCGGGSAFQSYFRTVSVTPYTPAPVPTPQPSG